VCLALGRELHLLAPVQPSISKTEVHLHFRQAVAVASIWRALVGFVQGRRRGQARHCSPIQISGGSMQAALEASAMRNIYLRLLPFAVLSYILAYIDRINVSFAGLTMRGDLDLTATDFGFALGTFFLGYFIFEVPSNVIMEKVGARIWIARIMITWGMFAGIWRSSTIPRASPSCGSCSAWPRPGSFQACCSILPTGSRAGTTPGSFRGSW